MTVASKESGATLIEVILVLVIISFILNLSINQYQSYRRGADVVQLQANVDLLFTSMGAYFQANCSNQQNALSDATPLTKPLSSEYPKVNYAVPIETLMSDGFLVLNNNAMQVSPLVDSESQGQGYIMQFNQYQAGGTLPTRTQAMSEGEPQSVGGIVLWQAQVAVKLLNEETAEQYKNILGATCLSNLSGDIVTPCDQASGGNYAVFVRGPSRPTSKANSIYWLNNPTVKLFKQEYTTYPITILTDKPANVSQFYTCGS